MLDRGEGLPGTPHARRLRYIFIESRCGSKKERPGVHGNRCESGLVDCRAGIGLTGSSAARSLKS
jgi:hypothetical protein